MKKFKVVEEKVLRIETTGGLDVTELGADEENKTLLVEEVWELVVPNQENKDTNKIDVKEESLPVIVNPTVVELVKVTSVVVISEKIDDDVGRIESDDEIP